MKNQNLHKNQTNPRHNGSYLAMAEELSRQAYLDTRDKLEEAIAESHLLKDFIARQHLQLR